jgi:hypothetical protein
MLLAIAIGPAIPIGAEQQPRRIDVQGSQEGPGQKGLPLAAQGNGAHLDPMLGRATV